MSSWRPTSQGTGSPSMSAATSRSFASFRSARTTPAAPSAANFRAVARPMPLAAPVTMATLPSMSMLAPPDGPSSSGPHCSRWGRTHARIRAAGRRSALAAPEGEPAGEGGRTREGDQHAERTGGPGRQIGDEGAADRARAHPHAARQRRGATDEHGGRADAADAGVRHHEAIARAERDHGQRDQPGPGAERDGEQRHREPGKDVEAAPRLDQTAAADREREATRDRGAHEEAHGGHGRVVA